MNSVFRGLGHWCGCFVIFFVLTQTAKAVQLPFADNFADRGEVTGTLGAVLNNNYNATREKGEPRHGDTPAKSTVWVSWVAPQDGILTIRAVSSDILPVVGVYANDLVLRNDTFVAGYASTTLDQISEVGTDIAADGEGSDVARVDAPVRAGVRYDIAVAGVGRSTGAFKLTWSLRTSSLPVARVIGKSRSRAARPGDPIVVSADVISTTGINYQWLRDGQEIPGATSPVWAIPSVGDTDVGTYTLRMINPAVDSTDPAYRVFGRNIDVQLNSGDRPGLRAADALKGALALAYGYQNPTDSDDVDSRNGTPTGILPDLPPLTVIHSYTGSLTFSTASAQSDPNEPIHCGVVGGASYWYGYVPVANGSMSVNTMGSSFDTILAVYSYNPAIGGYAGLTPVACQNNQWAGNTSSAVSYPVTGSVMYFIVIDGVNGARGTAKLNYNYLPAPPTLANQPAPAALVQGQNATFFVSANGPVANSFQWRFGGVPISGATGTTLTVPGVTAANCGRYDVVVRNSGGSTISSAASLSVVETPTIARQPVSLQVAQGQPFTVSASAAGGGSLQYQWRLNGVPISGATSPTYGVGFAQAGQAGGYSVSVANAAGAVTSATATITVVAAGTPPVITVQPVGNLVVAGANCSLSAAASGATGYQWYRNGAEVPSANASTLALSNVQTAQGGDYSVRASNSAGQVISQPVALVVLPYAPKVRCASFTDGTGVSCASIYGLTYLLQSRSSFSTGGWQTVQSTVGNGGTITFIDVPDPSKRFFRIVAQQ